MTTDLIFAEENVRWFIVLLAAIAGAVLGAVLPKAVGVTITAQVKMEAINECLVIHQFAYFGYYTSLLTAVKVRNVYQEAYVLAIVVAFVFFAVGLFNLKTGAAAGTTIIKVNAALAIVSFLAAMAVIGSLQYAQRGVAPEQRSSAALETTSGSSV